MDTDGYGDNDTVNDDKIHTLIDRVMTVEKLTDDKYMSNRYCIGHCSG